MGGDGGWARKYWVSLLFTLLTTDYVLKSSTILLVILHHGTMLYRYGSAEDDMLRPAATEFATIPCCTAA